MPWRGALFWPGPAPRRRRVTWGVTLAAMFLRAAIWGGTMVAGPARPTDWYIYTSSFVAHTHLLKRPLRAVTENYRAAYFVR